MAPPSTTAPRRPKAPPSIVVLVCEQVVEQAVELVVKLGDTLMLSLQPSFVT